MLNYYATRDAHLAQAQALVRERHGHDVAAELPQFALQSQSAYALVIHWLADFAAENPEWVRQFEQTAERIKELAKKPIVAAVVERYGLTGFEVGLADVFIGCLIDVAFGFFIRWERGRLQPGQTMFHGELSDTWARWKSEVPIG